MSVDLWLWLNTQASDQPGPMERSFHPNSSGLTSRTAILILNDVFIRLFHAGLFRSIKLTVICLFFNIMLLKIVCAKSWTRRSLMTWRFHLVSWTSDICTESSGFNEEILTECTHHVIFLAASEGLEIQHRAGSWLGFILQLWALFWVWGFSHLTPNNFHFSHHVISWFVRFCCDHRFCTCFFQLCDKTLHLDSSIWAVSQTGL